MNGFLFVIDGFDGRHYVIRLCALMARNSQNSINEEDCRSEKTERYALL